MNACSAKQKNVLYTFWDMDMDMDMDMDRDRDRDRVRVTCAAM